MKKQKYRQESGQIAFGKTPIGDRERSGARLDASFLPEGSHPSRGPLEHERVRVVEQAIANGVDDGRGAEVVMPASDRDLAGEERGPVAVAVLDDLEQIATARHRPRARVPSCRGRVRRFIECSRYVGLNAAALAQFIPRIARRRQLTPGTERRDSQ